MKRWFGIAAILLGGLLLAGCSQPDSNAETPNVNKNLSVLVPEYTELSKIRLPNGRRYVSLGDTEEKANAVFPRPSRAFTLLEEIVPGLPNDFRGKGWDSSTEGFGVILHDDKIVLAMHQYEGIEPDEFASILENIKAINGLDHFQSVTQDKAEYWFTKFGPDVLSISRLPTLKRRYQVTITIGNEHLLDSLGILKDVKKIDNLPNSEKHVQ